MIVRPRGLSVLIEPKETARMRRFMPYIAIAMLILTSVVGADFPTSWP
jgi:hypothetical protein